jgi:ABC-type molybdate transport system permease subunit
MVLLTAAVMLFVAGLRFRYLGAAVGAGVIFVVLAILAQPYRIERIKAFLDPGSDPQGSGFQLAQSRLAVGSGGLTGVGFGMGQQKAYYLPAPHTDFIFSVVGEEFGLVGTLTLLAVVGFVAWRGLRATLGAPNRFAYYVALGGTMLIVLQALIHMGVCVGLLPTKGLPFPLVSYGGSSLIASFAVVETRGSRLLDGLVLLPLGASAVMLGLGFLIAFDSPPLDFRAAPWIVPVAQALVAIPFVVRIVVPTLRSIDQRQREAAALLGASPGRVRREIDLPIVSRGLAVAAGFAFAISLGEFGATVFLARPDRPTLPVAIFRFLGRPGESNVAEAYALAVVLLGVTVVSVLLVERLRPARDGWF